jgi:hypothetical protein
MLNAQLPKMGGHCRIARRDGHCIFVGALKCDLYSTTTNQAEVAALLQMMLRPSGCHLVDGFQTTSSECDRGADPPQGKARNPD